MLRYLFVRRTDWTVLVITCSISLTLMLLEPRVEARVAWFIQHTLLAPFEYTVGWVDRSVGVFWENHQLRRRLTQLQMESDALQAERRENVRLRRLLSLEERHPYSLVAANVVARSLDRLGGSLTIDKGTADGVEPGRAVLTPDGLVGRAERATPRETRVLTLLNRDCAVAARIERTRVDGILEWEFGSQPALNLRYVSSQEDVKVGDRVVTSGLGGIFPVGIRIGTVAKVSLDPNGLLKEILVQPSVDFRSIEEILVYTPSDLRGVAPADLFLEEPKPEAAPADSAAGDSAAVRPKVAPPRAVAARVQAPDGAAAVEPTDGAAEGGVPR